MGIHKEAKDPHELLSWHQHLQAQLDPYNAVQALQFHNYINKQVIYDFLIISNDIDVLVIKKITLYHFYHHS